MVTASLRFHGKSPRDVADTIARAARHLPGELEAAAEDIGLRVIATARRLVRVDTGRLRASLEHEVERVGKYAISVAMGSNVDYSIYIEVDYPYLRPAIEAERKYIEKRVAEAESAAWNAVL